MAVKTISRKQVDDRLQDISTVVVQGGNTLKVLNGRTTVSQFTVPA